MIDHRPFPGMISVMSLRLLYLIFQHTLGLLLLMSRASFTKGIELLVLRHEDRHASPHQPEAPHGLGGPGRLRRLVRRPSLGHPRHDPALASPPRSQEVDL